jgi:hypothetical protein
MNHPRVVIVALIVIVIATAVVARAVAASSGDPRDGTTATLGATGTDGVATGVAGTLRMVNPGGPMIAADGSPTPGPVVVVELLSPTTNAVVARGRVSANGGFRVPAPPGSYRVRVAPAAGGPSVMISHLIDVTDEGYARLPLGPVRGL